MQTRYIVVVGGVGKNAGDPHNWITHAVGPFDGQDAVESHAAAKAWAELNLVDGQVYTLVAAYSPK